MAKLVLQLQVIVIVLTFFLIVIDHHICGASEDIRIDRDYHDTFSENSNHTNCTGRNANCTKWPVTVDSGCLECTCLGQYKTYLLDRCVRDDELLDNSDVIP
ncbi:Hypothetical predicted protein, partial [Paramuricea clavata]